MKYFRLNGCLASLVFAAASLGGAAHANSGTALDDPLGMHRLLVLCLLENDSDSAVDVAEIYGDTNWKSFAERDLHYIELHRDAAYIVAPETHSKRKRIRLRSDKALRQESDCGNDFEAVLIGNDGMRKSRWAGKLSFQDLFATIDAMPFRRFEMRQKAKRN